uniref:Uncharacterized protein n=1 Tax=Zea mays TaxID=4577 RepID=A0A804MR16_MAIZE
MRDDRDRRWDGRGRDRDYLPLVAPHPCNPVCFEWLEEIQVTEAILAFSLLQQRCEDEVLEVAY